MLRLSPQQARLCDDLRGLVEGDVFCDDSVLRLFAVDAGWFAIRPVAVVRPRCRKDVIACVKYAAEKGIPLHPRGAGTGRAGGALGPGLVLDFSRHMRRTIRLDDHSVTVQPGITRSRLNRILQKHHNRMIGPDGGFSPATTLGSMLACDGAGAHWLRYGFLHEHLLSLETVLADGEVLELSHRPQGKKEEPPPHGRLGDAVRDMLLPHRHTIRIRHDRRTPNRAGYRLDGVLRATSGAPDIIDDSVSDEKPYRGNVDLLPLFCGSEGTLGIVTEMRLKSVPVPPHCGTVLLLFDALEKAARSVPEILPFAPSACDMIDRRRLNMLREWDKRFQNVIPRETEALLVVACDGESAKDLKETLNGIVDVLRFGRRLSFGSRIASDEEESALLAELLRKGELALAGMPKTFRAIPLFDGVAVPVETLPEFLVIAQNIFKKHGVFASFFGHIGHGHLKIDPIIDLRRENPGELLLRLAEDVYEEIIRQGGSISCDGACGLVSSRFLQRQSGALFPLFRGIKTLFDPENLLNPGKVIPEPETDWNHMLRVAFREPETAPE